MLTIRNTKNLVYLLYFVNLSPVANLTRLQNTMQVQKSCEVINFYFVPAKNTKADIYFTTYDTDNNIIIGV